ncbi:MULTISPECIES: SDR family oxidoreductase [unclassified Roseateles]|uniref:SDR family NAD(P)-dependent oxidoreductase n=1 Tax=unclassified Roseateles TaxID=2626991 RepID=UPI0006FFA2A3|nr:MULTISPECIES: SDR family NAD(P)-dependent oxidoreductase [unclassified Roseateles]KQW46747.1 oxidoreductase [Pelomonas sp. Root405]KRA73373.1 oxidoreductase [Pelomonas sp. Root662]
MNTTARPLAVVTGASSGIGRELARLCAEDGHDLVIAADEGPLDEVAQKLRAQGADVTVVKADLATADGVRLLLQAIAGRPVAALLANAGHGLGRGFLDQDFADVRHVIDTNITGTLDLIQQVGRDMRTRGHGRILVTGSIAGLLPGSFQAVYNASKSFIDSFCYALRDELKDTGITVTCLMPGPTDTHFFARADMTDTKVGTDDKKADPADVAKAGYEAMKDGESDVVAGWKNKLQAILANVTPAELLAAQHRRMAEPGTAKS